MLAPPPNEADRDANALEPEGRERYLLSLENRLKKLEGRDGRLTSKDMLSALSEARDDHLSGKPETSNCSSFVNDSAERWEESDVGNGGFFATYCCWCGGRGYLRRSRRQRDFNIEEYSCLLDCDELEISTNSNNRNNNASSDQQQPATEDNNQGFTDNFVTS